MAKIKPFRAIRPAPEQAAQVAALPYDVMTSEEAREMVRDNPYSFLHIDKAEIDLDPATHQYDDRVYQQAAANLEKFRSAGILVQDEQACFYIYQLTMEGRTQTGLVACTAIDDYLNNEIKKHEYTRPDKEQDRTKHVDYCNAHTGPIFMTYRSRVSVKQCLGQWMKSHLPVYDFVSDDGIGHQVWVVDEERVLTEMVREFTETRPLYIADGHHRTASAVNVGVQRRKAFPDYTGAEEFNYFLAVLFPDDELRIMDYNRVVKDLNGLSSADFLQRITEHFLVEEVGLQSFRPLQSHTFGMYLDNRWYKLTAKANTFDQHDPVARLDVSILQNNLLAPILGIRDPRTDPRIDFIGGIRGLEELERRVQQGMAVAFSMYPTTIEELLAVADRGQVMPPKSTWFEPKLRSGLFIHELK